MSSITYAVELLYAPLNTGLILPKFTVAIIILP
jgi:hypothetical protein